MKKTLLFTAACILLAFGQVFGQNPPETQWVDNADITWFDDQSNEYTLSTSAQLAGLSVLVNGGNDFSDITLVLGGDLDIGTHLWTPIGNSNDNPFSGSFEGNNYTISNLFIVIPGGDFIGLFGQCVGATINDTRIENSYIRSGDTVGSVAGNVSINSSLTNCHATGVDIVATGFNVGGLVGGLLTDSNMDHCSSIGSVSGESQVGGLVGSPWNLTNITECYAEGTVSAQYLAGGLIGFSTFAFLPNRDNTIDNCYSRCDVSVVLGRAGGLVGGTDANLFVYNSYSTGTATGPELAGGFMGAVGSVTTENNYWDLETSEHLVAIGGWLGAEGVVDVTSKTTAEMKTQDMIDLLNANQTEMPWTIEDGVNDGYPILATNNVLSTNGAELERIEVAVFPTIVIDVVNITSDATLKNFSLFTLSGKMVMQGSLNGQNTVLDMKGLAAGSYILVLNTDGGIASEKLIKQ